MKQRISARLACLNLVFDVMILGLDLVRVSLGYDADEDAARQRLDRAADVLHVGGRLDHVRDYVAYLRRHVHNRVLHIQHL